MTTCTIVSGSLRAVDDSNHRHRITSVPCRGVIECNRSENEVSDRIRSETMKNG